MCKLYKLQNQAIMNVKNPFPFGVSGFKKSTVFLSKFKSKLKYKLPCQCAVCKAWPADALVCAQCVDAFAQPQPRCKQCAVVLPMELLVDVLVPEICHLCKPHEGQTKNNWHWDSCFAAVSYGYPWSNCISSFKFNANPMWAPVLGQIISNAPWVADAVEWADVIVPVPLSKQRLQKRGFNQAQLLALQLNAKKTHAGSGILLRVQHTVEQSDLTREQRLQNLAHAFVISPLCFSKIAGKKILLVDDVLTTGSTLDACAKVLKRSGASGVVVAVLART